jgi:hypothetical protein
MANTLILKRSANRVYRLSAILVLFICLFCCPGAINTASAQVPTKTIYFLSGVRDHAPRGGGRHEVAKDMLVLQHCIDSIANVKGVKIITKYLAERSAINIDDLKGADAIIVEASSVTSQQTRTHPIFPPLAKDAKGYDRATLAYLNQIDSLQKAGMGIMMLHWGIAADSPDPKYNAVRDHYFQWFGEAAIPAYSQNPLGFWVVTPIKASAKHPILRGVKPWVYKDEIFSRLIVNPGDPYRTDLLMGESPETNQSEVGSPKGVISPRCIASAYEKGKQRGVLWGGMDFHSALLNENYLRFVLNEIVWVAGIDVPKGGVKTNAKQLQLAPINTTYENTKIPEGYIPPKLPNTK